MTDVKYGSQIWVFRKIEEDMLDVFKGIVQGCI